MASGISAPRRRGRVAEGGGLLNRYTLQRRIEGSNPSVSARFTLRIACLDPVGEINPLGLLEPVQGAPNPPIERLSADTETGGCDKYHPEVDACFHLSF